MNNNNIFVFFYFSNEFDLKDIDKEIYTKNQKEIFHLFFFNNKNLHFDKNIIINNELNSIFNALPAEYILDKHNNTILLTKKINNFNFIKFDNDTDNAYNKYLVSATHRIDSIIQTFNLFIKFYTDKDLFFIVPYKIFNEFSNNLKEKNISYETIQKNSNILLNYDIYYWINYFSRFDEHKGRIDENNIQIIYKINF